MLTKYFDDNIVLEICENKKFYYDKLIAEQYELVDKAKTLLANCKDSEQWYFEMLVEDREDRYNKLKNRRYYWIILEKQTRGEKIPEGYNLELIKRLPFSIVIGEPKWNDGTRAWYLCMLHSEQTPSFCHFIKQNRYYCFGCGEGGDIIDLYMKINNVDFKTAVNNLS